MRSYERILVLLMVIGIKFLFRPFYLKVYTNITSVFVSFFRYKNGISFEKNPKLELKNRYLIYTMNIVYYPKFIQVNSSKT